MILTDSTVVMHKLAPPGSFASLMTLYESNYVRLGWLVRDLAALEREQVSIVARDCPLYLAVQEVCRYTTTLHLTYYFADPTGTVADPDLAIRVYHDARLAEAMDCGSRRRHAALKAYDTARGSELVRCWTRNVMLNKWLEFCADRGHGFARPPPREPGLP